MQAPDFSMEVQISFGHCDPAGIVFYPNYFRWFDRCFHSFLQKAAGGHRKLCRDLDAQGIGLMDVHAKFLSPALDGDLMTLELRLQEWGDKTLTLDYLGRIGDRHVVRGTELRGMFIRRDGRMRAGEMAPLRAALGLTAPV
ncbi:acyl-CoA thioesterase [Pseudodonghicola flavimaris]|uniref:Acyl-CoA thioesterase n=1 Tax=Pseudodonghicola flavimaris TaxID=3050036 RepID=A0ABT7EXZ8_9RHOB|nr:acyl-CoA thioesterase [Pseudodonghicola flavimaris]MDK3017226.1 acyl-CoA thioesterase [Pseudodonghicola flavimaris]